MHLKDGDLSRSIAILFVVSKYLKHPDFSLPAIDNDRRNLERFLVKDQKFDEVIVLNNSDATSDNLRYFLKDYVRQRALQYNGNTRILLAISAHGVQRPSVLQKVDTAIPPSVGIALQNAVDADDQVNIYGLGELLGLLYDTAKDNYHVGVLVNACFGGQIFSNASPGGSGAAYDAPGARAMTAGPATTEVATLGGKEDGSVFFDTLIDGIRTGEADVPAKMATRSSKKSDLRGVVRWNELNGYLQERVRQLAATDASKMVSLDGNLYSWEGSIEPVPVVAQGGFFFFQPLPEDGLVPASAAAVLSHGPTFLPPSVLADAMMLPQTYNPEHSAQSSSSPLNKTLSALRAIGAKASGIDVGSYSGEIDWLRVKKSGLQFVYVRASQGSVTDASFATYDHGVKHAGIAHGAYHSVNFCEGADDQAKHFGDLIKGTDGSLPPAIRVDLYSKDQQNSNIAALRTQGVCASHLGIEGQRELIRKLTNDIISETGFRPLLYAPAYFVQQVLAEDAVNYLLWRPRYGAASDPPSKPWVIWQYSQNGRVDGIGAGVNLDLLGNP